MPWFAGATLLDVLETIDVSRRRSDKFRFPVQRVSRSDSQFRGYQGSVAGGRIHRGDPIVALPSGQPSRIERIVTYDGDLEEAVSGQAITLVLADEIEAGRGTVFAHPDAPPACVDHLVARLVWMADTKLELDRELLMRHITGFLPCRITAVRSRLDVVQLVDGPAATLGANDIGFVIIRAERPVAVDRYEDNHRLGAFLLVDRLTNTTLAAGMMVEAINPAANTYWQKFDVRQTDRSAAKKQAPAILWLTGPSGA
jgi:bifunctional enzyme CysN/CysC